MDFKDMTVDELEERKAAIPTELDNEGADLDALEEEVRNINAELETRKEAEAKRVEIREEVAKGAGKVEATIEDNTEARKMDVNEIRASQEYKNAYGELIKKNYDMDKLNEEMRALLTTNAAEDGMIAVPVGVDDKIRTAWENDEIMSRVRKTYFRGNLRVPFELSATGAWVHAEGTTGLTEEAITIGIVELKPENIKKWIRISDEVVAMGGESFVRYIYEEITYRILNKLVSELVAKVVAADASNGATSIGVPVLKQAPGVMTIADATSKLSEDARDLCIVINRLSEQSFNAAFAQANFAIDPYAGLPRIYTSALGAYSTLSENGVYGFVGDLSALQANYPEGEGIVIKWDDLSEAEDDLVKIVGRQYVGYGITAPGKLVKLTKPGA